MHPTPAASTLGLKLELKTFLFYFLFFNSVYSNTDQIFRDVNEMDLAEMTMLVSQSAL